MENLKKLEVIKLLKELEFVQSDFDYKSEKIKEVDVVFNLELENFLNQKPKLKFLLEEKKEYEIKNSPNPDTEVEEIVETETKDPKIKQLYRNIAKTIHPDKIGDENLKDIFIKATIAYDDNDLIPIISLCDRLNLPYEVDDQEINMIINQIEKLKDRIKFLESTYTWQWFQRPDKKDEIILSFIKAQLIK